MTDIEQRITELVSGFVNEITRLAREAAKNTLEAALAGTHGALAADTRGGRRGRGGRGGSSPAAALPSGGGASSRRPKGAKRPPDEIARTKDRVYSFINGNPGQRIEQINKQLGTRKSDLSLPLKKLLSEGAIRTEGARRATKYFPGDGKPGGGGGWCKGSRGRRKQKCLCPTGSRTACSARGASARPRPRTSRSAAACGGRRRGESTSIRSAPSPAR
jgi:hypothetical protein